MERTRPINRAGELKVIALDTEPVLVKSAMKQSPAGLIFCTPFQRRKLGLAARPALTLGEQWSGSDGFAMDHVSTARRILRINLMCNSFAGRFSCQALVLLSVNLTPEPTVAGD